MITDMITAAFTVIVFAALVALFTYVGRKTSDLPRSPFGSDAPDRDLDRVWHDVDATRSHDPAFG